MRGLFLWIGRHVRGFHAALGAYLVIGFGLVLVLLGSFALLARLVVGGTTRSLDEAVLLWMYGLHTGWLNVTFLEITALGSGPVVSMMALVAGAFLWLTRHRYSALLLGVAVIGGFLLNALLKEVFYRPRPELFEWVTYAGRHSFPSGHAMNAAIAYGTLAYLVARLEPTQLMRRVTWLFAAGLIGLIGVSRIYLGVHYPSDVIAGFAAGIAWAAVCALGIEAVRHFRARQPAVARDERDLDRPPPARPTSATQRRGSDAAATRTRAAGSTAAAPPPGDPRYP